MLFSMLIPWFESFGASLKLHDQRHFSCIWQKYHFECSRDANVPSRFYLMSQICQFPDLNEQAELFTALLRANLFGQGTHGAVIAADRKTKNIYYVRVFDLQRLNQNLFTYAINDFVQWLEGWKEGIAKKDYYWPFVKDTLGTQYIGDFWRRI